MPDFLMSEKNKIILPILLIALFVFSTFGWIYRFQNYQMDRIVTAERLLDQIRQEMHDINRTIQSGILTLDERYAVEAAGHSLHVFDHLSALEKLHSADAETIRMMYLNYYPKIVSINSLFLEKRLDEGRIRLAELETSYSEMNAQLDKFFNVRVEQHRRAVQNINIFMGVTSIIFTAVLILISALFIHYGKKRKEAEKALIESEKMASLGILSAGVAHEIRNPLTIILHGIELLGESIPPGSAQHETVSGIRKAVVRAEKIIKGLLSFSLHPSSGQERLDVISLVQEALLGLSQQREFQNIQTEMEFASDLPEIRGEGGQLRQALQNILANAIESMPDGGKLKIFCRRMAPDLVWITVADSGTGIDGAELGRVLDPFYTTKQKSGNVGLGLSISKGIIEVHGGSLRIESAPGEGTTVNVMLPFLK
jgi:signal transduction histidine kinase